MSTFLKYLNDLRCPETALFPVEFKSFNCSSFTMTAREATVKRNTDHGRSAELYSQLCGDLRTKGGKDFHLRKVYW